MVGTQITWHPELEHNVVIYDAHSVPEEIFRAAQVLVVDDVQWDTDMGAIRSHLIRSRRKFKQPFNGGVPPEIGEQLTRLGEHADRIVAKLYPGLTVGARRGSWRPKITGPEPLHFDTYTREDTLLTSFINVSKVPRVYALSYSLPQLVRLFPRVMRKIVAECKGDVDNFSYRLRQRTEGVHPPLDLSAARHRVEFAPGSIWFFDAKMLSHEVIYGEGAMGYSWPIQNKVPMQRDVLAQLA